MSSHPAMQMIKSLQIRLTIYLSVFLTILMVAVCAIYACITSANISNRNRLEYENNIIYFYSYLYQNDIISFSNISQLTDKGFYVELSGEQYSQKYRTASIPDAETVMDRLDITQTAEYWENYYDAVRQKVPVHSESAFRYEGIEYWVSYAVIQNRERSYTVTLLYSTLHEKLEIRRLCMTFSLVCLCATVVLFIISYYFVKKVLLPVKEAYNKQEEFIAVASHELRSPLTVIKASLSAMPNSGSEELEHYKSIANAECSRMSDLINDMLLLANMKRGRQKNTFQDCDPCDIVINCYNRFEKLVLGKGLSFYVSFPEQPLAHYKLDKDRITQLLVILLDNALSYTETGSITLSAYEEYGKLRLCVSDTGKGIPDSMKKRIFDKFFSADRSHSKNEHSGLGLSIAKEIAALHHAVIEVTDNEGGGSVFTILFP